jgi:hypothetical protein
MSFLNITGTLQQLEITVDFEESNKLEIGVLKH